MKTEVFKSEISPLQSAGVLAAVVALVGGLGSWYAFGSQKSYKPLPARSRGDIVRATQHSASASVEAVSVEAPAVAPRIAEY
jgi:hypothetical protein